ncbi:unnamed protein product [Brugia timori]|uniref:DNA polymerase III subunit theta n=1 Tax=Brugia timori TaxID=42155 RepID=A0A0R3R9X1_9BILA|nr:unnamed protein product [Brugia timori]
MCMLLEQLQMEQLNANVLKNYYNLFAPEKLTSWCVNLEKK